MSYYLILMLKPICIVCGTTGAGKSDLAVQLAKKFGTEVINADSMQVYRGFDTITNKISHEEQENVTHHLMSFLNYDQEYSVPNFEKDARRIIDGLHAQGKVPILVGGTNYYLQSLLFEDSTLSSIDPPLSHKVKHPDEGILNDENADLMFPYLQKVDPLMAERWHPRDVRKIRRSLEIYFHTGKRPSDIYKEQSSIKKSKLKYKTLLFWANAENDVLMPRLDTRVDKMLHQGLMNEIQSMKSVINENGFTPDLTRGIWQCIGFKEFEPWFQNSSQETFQACLDKMKISTKQYAKYQKKWILNRLLPLCVSEQKLRPSSILFSVANTTNLQKWHEQVERSCNVFSCFFNNQKLPPMTEEEQGVLEKVKKTLLTQDKDTFSTKFTCDVCLDKTGHPFVAIGEDAWQTHLQSRKHKMTVRRMKERATRQERIEAAKKAAMERRKETA
ncbi:tRNA isopentenyltransferase [Schizosaccharomyces cryophilus OY26]|uniref:tRNA dimethylallyltransferase n=1 Tax=Schizosaccharomyces cryophilus (strain OY26 / ATCC MYA-4695 / CBS 11777 / NBRC 106824 / NRRL Y48691) TaxID=653667 RepID=S9VU34_SCHCR|nr:tRNA isopentenyltransferase [Schizosaccharomyces cryophilus OY26]EPY49699.1 tRNA isopentenyltransferase [Schizosaccharomyces cryophilus OY26]